MDETKESDSSFNLLLDEQATANFAEILGEEGLMRAGFVIHESNNLVVEP